MEFYNTIDITTLKPQEESYRYPNENWRVLLIDKGAQQVDEDGRVRIRIIGHIDENVSLLSDYEENKITKEYRSEIEEWNCSATQLYITNVEAEMLVIESDDKHSDKHYNLVDIDATEVFIELESDNLIEIIIHSIETNNLVIKTNAPKVIIKKSKPIRGLIMNFRVDDSYVQFKNVTNLHIDKEMRKILKLNSTYAITKALFTKEELELIRSLDKKK